jgi:RNA recognition motif-containing protein
VTARCQAIFVGGVPPYVSEDHLMAYFQQFGEIAEIKIIYNKKTKKSKGFAMTKFKFPVYRSILTQSHVIGGRTLEVREYLSEEEAFVKLCDEKSRKIFVGGLPVNIDSQYLKKYFEEYGPVVEANVVYHHETMKSRGFAFVVFEHEQTVEVVLSRHEDHYIHGTWVSTSG